jgi:hypothetical protein
VAQGVGPEFNLQYHLKKKKKKDCEKLLRRHSRPDSCCTATYSNEKEVPQAPLQAYAHIDNYN